ncbi:MAG: DNA mismatch repair protein MutS [Cyclobacteriaceae bacterium]|nr:DNA mismatch repair protein MutS [Cyclobacteriaceae bacterium]
MRKRKDKELEALIATFGKPKGAFFSFDKIERYFRNKDNSTAFQVLSDKTCNDLDFQQLFMFLDRTNSKVGQQYLYNKLRTISVETANNELNERVIKKFIEDSDFRINTQKLLAKLGKNDVYYISSLFQEEHLKQPKWYFVVPLLSFTSILSIIMLFVIPQVFFILLVVYIINFGIHLWNKNNLVHYLGSIPELLRMKRIALKLYKDGQLLKEINPDLPDSIKIIDQVGKRMAFFQLEAKIQGEIEAFFFVFFELIKILFLIEPLMLFGVLKQLNTKRVEIENVFSFVGHIDALFAIASLRKGLDTYCIPKIEKKHNKIKANNLYHPLIFDCVRNNLEVKDKSILLTGSNMSGKTSFIRTIGINTITGLTINTCFAESFATPIMRIHSAIRISDDLMNDKSYYFEEVLTIKDMILKSTNGSANLFLLDEIYKGTNTIERISAGKAVLSYLAKHENLVFVSTHDMELTDLLSEEFDLYHFSEQVDDKNVDFDYTLKVGKLKNRNAIRILQINDYPANIINEAIELSERLDKIASASD